MADPLHGVTLEALLTELVEHHGWETLARRVPIRCFEQDPTLTSSLTFLRRTPWARAKVERVYLGHRAQLDKKRRRNEQRAARRAFAATMPVERDDTLAFFWPPGQEPRPVPAPEGYEVRRGLDRSAVREVQAGAGFEMAPHQADVPWVAMTVAFPSDGSDAEAIPVAVACAEPRAKGWVELTWVAVTTPHRGRGLGRAVCTDLVEALRADGHERIMGSTLDERIHALRIYLDMGFRPVRRPDKRARWDVVQARLRGMGPPVDG